MVASKSCPRKKVTFGSPEVFLIEPLSHDPSRRPRKSSLKMEEKRFQKFDGNRVTDSIIEEAAKLFSENYGVWGSEAAHVVGACAKEGTHVKMSKNRLRAQLLPNDATCSYVRVIVDGSLAGNAFACRWTCNGRSVCWVTQLVVHREYRERGLAIGLLNELRQDNDDVYGVVSSHAAACLATAKAFGSGLEAVKLGFIRDQAEAIMKASPISYIRDAKPCGSLFNPKESNGMVSSVDTNFFVDHAEPLEALVFVKENMDWPLGELIDGHEFLLILEAKRRPRSRSQGSTSS